MKKAESGLARLAGLAGLIITVLILAVSIPGCSIEKPEAPSWDASYVVPLVNKTYTSSELLDKIASEHIETDSAGNSEFRIEEQLDTVGINNTLTLEEINSNYSKQVGNIKIVSPEEQTKQLSFSEHISLIAGEVPDTGIWVAMSFNQPTSFSEAVVADGDLIVTVTNNTGFPLDSVVCCLTNNVNGDTIGNLTIAGGLDIDQFSVRTLPLDGKTIFNDIALDCYFHTAGGLALSLAGRVIDYHFTYSDEFFVSSATGKVDEFSTNYSQNTGIETDNHILEATFDAGQLNFTAQNNLPLTAQLDIQFPEITNSGIPLVISFTLPAGYEEESSIDIAGWVVEPANDSLRAEIDATLASSGGQFVTVSSTDNFNFTYQMTGLQFSQAHAVIAPTEIEWNEDQINIEIPTGFETVSLDQVDLQLTILNSSELSGEVEIELEGSNGKNFTLTGTIISGSIVSPSVNIITTTELADLLSPIPNSITVSGKAIVGDGATEVNISSADFLYATALLTAPMAMTLEAANIEGEKSELEIDEEIRERVDRWHEGVFHTEISNHLPLGAEITVYISTDSTTLYSDPLVTIGPLGFDQGVVGANGTVTSETITNSQVEVSSEDVQVFSNKEVYIGEIISLPGSNGETIRISSSDYFDIVGYLEVTARVGGEDL